MHSAHMAVPAADGHLRPDSAPGAYAFNWHSRASCAGCWSVPSGYVMTTVSKVCGASRRGAIQVTQRRHPPIAGSAGLCSCGVAAHDRPGCHDRH